MKRSRSDRRNVVAQGRKVLLVSHTSNLSGAPISLAQLARTLPAVGFDPLFFIPRHGPLEIYLKEWGVPYRVPARDARRGRVPVAGGAGFRVFAAFLRIVREERPALVHVNSLVRTWPVIASRVLRIPVVWHVREHLGGKRSYARLIHLAADRVVLISREQEELFRGLTRAVRISNAVDIAAFENAKPAADILSGLARGAIVVAYVGSIEPRKGLDILAEAAILLKGTDAIRFVAVGKAPPRHIGYRDRLLARLDEEGVGDRFRFLGERSDVPGILAASHLLCHPARIEAFGRVILEAMASRLPVVSTTVGEIPHIVDHGITGLLVPPGDARALGEALERLVSNPRLRKMMGEAGRRRVEERYGLATHSADVAELYRQVLL